jgi:RimJ/RimL family protein N-acetyltransferase
MGLPEIVAVTMAVNLRSRAVTRRIGMTSDPAEDFDNLRARRDVRRSRGRVRGRRGHRAAAGE